MDYKLVFKGISLTFLIIAITACHHDSNHKTNSREAIRVKTLTVSDHQLGANYSFSGTVEEESGTVVSFSAAGTIRTLTVAEGDRVKKGQLVGTLDDGSLRNAYEIAKATLNEAQDAYRRMKLLHDSNSLPDIRWVEVQSKLTQAENAAEIALNALNDAKLFAPISGFVSEKMASVGQTVAPGVPVVKILDISSVKVIISVPENEISQFLYGETADITSRATPGEIYSGKIVEKSITANPLSRSYSVKYQVNDTGHRLLPGMICDVMVENLSFSEGIFLPVSAVLLAADNSHFVWLDSLGFAKKRMVLPGVMLPEGIMIESGLNDGDKVIVAGMDKVSQGSKVVSIN